jgi:hypothetical protein
MKKVLVIFSLFFAGHSASASVDLSLGLCNAMGDVRQDVNFLKDRLELQDTTVDANCYSLGKVRGTIKFLFHLASHDPLPEDVKTVITRAHLAVGGVACVGSSNDKNLWLTVNEKLKKVDAALQTVDLINRCPADR